MQFKNPALLYALFLLLIPIIIHLFQLRKFKKQSFTNVAFLKKVTLQTRKSSQIKKWLILLTRMALIAAIVVAFAQPFISKNKTFNAKKETVIYLDNSFSMQVKGEKGELLKRAINDIVANVQPDETITLLTNQEVYKNTSVKAITNDLLSLKYATKQLSYDAALLKSKKYFTKNKSTIKNLVFISDFQQKEMLFKTDSTTGINLNLVQLKPVNTNNVLVDSVFISNRTTNNITLTVVIKNNGTAIDNLPVSLYNNGNLLTKSAVSINKQEKVLFTLPAKQTINGEIVIEDANLKFDNKLFFNINATTKINVLSVNQNDDDFLKRIYTKNEFNYQAVNYNKLNYSTISKQNLIILNELKQIPNALKTALKAFTTNGGVLIIIPNKNIDLQSYNSILQNYNFSPLSGVLKVNKRITTINYSHPLYKEGVFEKQVTNFQYPKVNTYYPQNLNNASAILSFEDGKPFLSEHNNAFLFTSALNKDNTNFTNINLIVPTFYNISKRSLKLANLYYTISKENKYDVAVSLQQDVVLTLENKQNKVIPQQHYFNNKVAITTNETPEKSGIYSIKNNSEIIENVSYNYARDESNLVYQQFLNTNNLAISNSVSQTLNTIKSNTKVNALWKWFVIFALIILIIEMLILKYFK